VEAQLRSFLVVARHGNVSRAAEEMFAAQSTVSRHIQQLEARLQIPLFRRAPHGVALTEQGEAFIPYAVAVLEATDAACEAAQALGAAPRGKADDKRPESSSRHEWARRAVYPR
jgi:DNA-binding transcriptional LysR family regulator